MERCFVIMKLDNKLILFKELYESGMNLTEIAKSLNVCKKTITNYEKKLGVKCPRTERKPNLDDSFFNDIDNEYKAYILGFIFADGYIESNERTVTLNINSKDIDILLKIKKHLKCQNDIRKSSTSNCIRLYMSSINLVKSLNSLGVTRNKTYSLKMPSIENDLVRHFLRGYFDGDGHIGKRQCALVIGSKQMYEDFNNIIMNKFKKKLYCSSNDKYYRIQFNRSDFDIIKWLYDDCNIYLDRKYKAYIENWSNYKPKG